MDTRELTPEEIKQLDKNHNMVFTKRELIGIANLIGATMAKGVGIGDARLFLKIFSRIEPIVVVESNVPDPSDGVILDQKVQV